MTKIIIIHGTGGNPDENWFSWLRLELQELGHTVFVPEFPTPKNQSLDTWMQIIDDQYLHLIDNDTLLIGHSLGPAFILSILEKIKEPCKACFFIAGFLGLLNNQEFDELNKTFTTKEFNWEKIKQNCKKFYVMNSDNDPYVPVEKGQELAKKLQTEVITIKNAGHINTESGYTKFPQLLEYIKQQL